MNDDEVRAQVLSLPEVEERETWGHPTFRVRGKIFASLPDDPGTLVVKASLSEQRALVAADAQTFAAAPRVGRYGWVSIRFADVDPAQLRELLDAAWDSVAPAGRQRSR